MKAFLKSVVAGLLAVLLTAPAASAQERPAFSPEELDQMLAPIALYPDPLLTQVLMAASYPLEVVQAARWSRANSHLKGQDAVRAVESMDWDPSVKSLVAFPQILHRMDENLDWTQRLGEAFLEQEPHVMDAIQGLRKRAEAAGNLRPNEQVRVTRQDGDILVEPAQPQVVYVPYYDPTVAYGGWWWPAYPPVYWGPPPGYYAWPGIYWGPAVAFSWGFFFGHFDWHHRHVKVVPVHHPHARAVPHSKPVKWQHDPVHRRNVPYRHVAWRQPAGQHPAMRGDERSRPVARPEPRSGHRETRSAAPQARTRFAAPQPRLERGAPQVRDRLPERSARADPQRPQLRAPESRTATVVPRITPLPRPAVPPPAVRAESRPVTAPPAPRPTPRQGYPVANARPAPQQRFEPGRRAEARSPVRPSAVTPRATGGAPVYVQRMDSRPPRATARSFGGGQPQARSYSGAGNGRRF
ncbi:MAG TPA: DUF3300 domain-containing protein [Burkholderiales bacterium]|nr:DUF3300 domain-containing protein [Burkholderiales bacterium]